MNRKLILSFAIYFLVLFFIILLWNNQTETLIFLKIKNKSISSSILECRQFSDLTSYCLYENICVENNDLLFLTENTLLNQSFEYEGHIRQWVHYEPLDQAGNVISKKINNPLPFRSFINGKYVSPSFWEKAEKYTVPF
ncbi:unnamed protein product [Brachionus calyciflorus]|uniref:Uncharacterized protein n=1 Tax=Brachionus calyciflorus TaxID=104777 RepID=A0A814M4L1_9BILA|nr:unnamed protein product [Brachionus calyciflorus]